MSTHLDGVQSAAVHVLAVMGAAGDRAVDGIVGGALAAVVGAAALLVIAHCGFLPNKKVRSGAESLAFHLPDPSVSVKYGSMQLKIFEIVMFYGDGTFYAP